MHIFITLSVVPFFGARHEAQVLPLEVVLVPYPDTLPTVSFLFIVHHARWFRLNLVWTLNEEKNYLVHFYFPSACQSHTLFLFAGSKREAYPRTKSWNRATQIDYKDLWYGKRGKFFYKNICGIGSTFISVTVFIYFLLLENFTLWLHESCEETPWKPSSCRAADERLDREMEGGAIHYAGG